MDRGRSILHWMLVTVGFSLAMIGAPQTSDAAVRFGADAIWVPLAADSVQRKSEVLDSTHKVSSFGASVHGGLGFDLASVSLKLNYFNKGLDVQTDEGTDKIRRNQLDVNAMVRISVPGTKVALFTEGGASTTTNFDGLGYNAGLGAEYTLFSVPLIEFNLGLEGQYVKLPAKLNDIETNTSSGRMLIILGADFGP